MFQDHPPTHEELTTINNNNEVIIAQDENVKSLLVINVSPQRPQGMNCVHNSIGKIDKK